MYVPCAPTCMGSVSICTCSATNTLLLSTRPTSSRPSLGRPWSAEPRAKSESQLPSCDSHRPALLPRVKLPSMLLSGVSCPLSTLRSFTRPPGSRGH